MNCTLTTGVDAIVGGSGNDTFSATNVDLGALDSIDGGAGVNTLSITDTGSITSRVIPSANIQNIQKVNVSSATGSVGAVASGALVDMKQVLTLDLSKVSFAGGGTVTLNVGGVTKSITVSAGAGDSTFASTVATEIERVCDIAFGTATYVSTSGTTLTITADTAGVALPPITLVEGTAGLLTYSTGYSTDTQPNQVATASVAASTFSIPTGATEATISAATTANVSSVSTATTTVSGTTVVLSGGASQKITASNSVTATGTKGAVVINSTKTPAAVIDSVSTTGWSAGAGIYVTGGSTVDITGVAGTSTAGSTPSANAKNIQIGANPAKATDASGDVVQTATASTYPQAVGNLSLAPTGNVSSDIKTVYTDTKGYKNVKYGTGDVSIYMNGGTTATVTGADEVTIKDLGTVALKSSSSATATPGTSNLTTVNLKGVTNAASITTDAITNLSIVDSSTTATIYSNTGKNTGALAVSIGNSTATVSASNASAINVTGVTSAYQKIGGTLVAANSDSTLTLTAAKATAVSFAGASDVTLASSTLTAMTKITSTSANKVTLGDVTGYSKLATVDASGATGSLVATVGGPGTYGMTLTGGSGDDTVTLKASATVASGAVDGVTVTTSVSLGGGNDSLVSGGSVTVGAGAVLDGGAGTDTVAAVLINAGNAAIFKNFEILDLNAATSGGALDASLLTNSTITGLALSDDIASAGTFTVSKITGTALTLNVTDTGSSSAGNITATLATSTGTADTAAITFAAKTAGTGSSALTSKVGTFKTTGIESLSINSGGTVTVTGDTLSNSLALFEDASNTTSTITITGARGFTLGAYTSSTSYTDGVEQYTTAPTTEIATATQAAALKTIDASGATGAVTIVAGATQTDVHSNTAQTDLIFTGLTITGGSGADKLVNTAAAGVVNGGDGADSITVTGSGAVVDGGAGNDTITVNAGVSTTLTGGTGNNTYVLTAAKAGSAYATAPKITKIMDYKTSDTLQIGDSDPLHKADVSTATTLQGALELAAADGAGGDASWFVWGSDTYIVKDDSTGDTLSANDIIVQLVGVFDLSPLTGDSTTGLVGIA